MSLNTHIHWPTFNLLESIPKEIVWVRSLAIILLCILYVPCQFCQLFANCLLYLSVKDWMISLAVVILISIDKIYERSSQGLFFNRKHTFNQWGSLTFTLISVNKNNADLILPYNHHIIKTDQFKTNSTLSSDPSSDDIDINLNELFTETNSKLSNLLNLFCWNMLK